MDMAVDWLHHELCWKMYTPSTSPSAKYDSTRLKIRCDTPRVAFCCNPRKGLRAPIARTLINGANARMPLLGERSVKVVAKCRERQLPLRWVGHSQSPLVHLNIVDYRARWYVCKQSPLPTPGIEIYSTIADCLSLGNRDGTAKARLMIDEVGRSALCLLTTVVPVVVGTMQSFTSPV